LGAIWRYRDQIKDIKGVIVDVDKNVANGFASWIGKKIKMT
jgi:hypothetical protein